MTLDPAARILRARLAAYAMHSKHSIESTTKDGLEAANGRFEREVDPTYSLPITERIRRADAARHAHMTKLSFLAREARKRRRPPK